MDSRPYPLLALLLDGLSSTSTSRSTSSSRSRSAAAVS